MNTDRQIEQLYDLKTDPWEENNLVMSTEPAHIAAREELQKVVDSMPHRDARPQYDRRPANPWDRKV